MRWLLLLVATLACVACGGGSPARSASGRDVRVVSTGPEAPGCMYAGEVRGVALSTARGGWSALWLKRAAVTASLHASAEAETDVRLDAQARVAGFELSGRLGSRALVLREASFFGPLVLAPAGLSPLLKALEAGRIRATLASPRGVDALFPHVRFRQRPEASLACTGLGLRQTGGLTGHGDTARDAVGLAPDAPLLRVRGGDVLGLSATPGGPVLAVMDVSVGDGALGRHTYARLLERRPASTRVVFESWREPLLVAWVPSARLEEAASSGVGGLLGGIGTRDHSEVQTFPVCSSTQPLTLLAVRGNATEAIGTIQPRQRFVRGRAHEQYLEIAPHPEDDLKVVRGASLWIESAPLSCDTQPPVYGRSLRGLATNPPLDFHASVRVEASEGLDGVAAGSSCDLRVRYRPTGFFYPCRAELRCGEHVLYGTRSSNGFLGCEVHPGEPRWLTAVDDATHEDGGDPALAIDSRAGTLEIRDEASDAHGAYSLRGRFETFEAMAAP
ncbi:MAG: hypothetical protein GXP55_08395 [Deltaproteobacteria bacterium]|nr:hypothetical protein [Deltaproteobacteria bacterium]